MGFKICLFLTSLLLVCGASIAEQPEAQECVPTKEMLDASAKLPAGIISGNMVEMGAYDQCLAIKEDGMKGKYCIVKVKFPLDILTNEAKNVVSQDKQHSKENRIIINTGDLTDPIPGLLLGWCIPDQCPIENATNIISPLLNQLITGSSVVPVLQTGLCQTADDLNTEITASEWGVIGFLAAIGAIMVLSTLYDTYCYYSKKEPAHILLIAFSIKTNGEKLLTVNHNPNQLPCLNGLRFLSMMWVIYGHRFTNSFMQAIINLGDLTIFMQKLANMYMINAAVSVDTFLVLSGLLVGYVFLLAKDKGVNFNIIMFYLHRYIRLTPALGVAVLIHATIIERLGSGPFWPYTTSGMKLLCTDNWWSTILYISNYYNPQAICIGQTWYLSVDTQLFFLSPIILIPLWRWPKYTMIGLVFLVIGSIVSPFVVSYHFDLPAFMITTDPNYMNEYYFPTHTRFGPWLIGLMLGYYIYTLKKDKRTPIRLHPAQVACGWIVSLTLLFTVLYGGHNLTTEYNRVAIAFFNSLHRHVWALGVCWVIYACTQGYGGPINSFLSWSVFQVLGRFTYTMYLTHMSLQYMMAGAARTNIYVTEFYNIHIFWADFAITLFMSVCLTLSFESPMLTIEKVLFKTGAKSQKPKLPVHQNTTQTNNNIEHND